MTRLVQFAGENTGRGVASASDDGLTLIEGFRSTYELAVTAIRTQRSLSEMVESHRGARLPAYEDLIRIRRLLPPMDHPDPARCWVTGTGLTHLGGASARDRMHASSTGPKTDSMKMFEMGLQGGKPAPGTAGVQPEWFYKGDGSCIAAPGGPIPSPAFSLLDGEEIEICAIYVIGPDGAPFRVGFALGNEFSDHRMEKMNYLYLAPSKLRACAFGPELRTGPLPEDIRGVSRIIRGGHVVWEQPFASGEANMSHTLANLEHHLFKYPLFRRPGDVHCHFLGTATLSYSDGVEPQHGDVFEMQAEGFGPPLRNTLARDCAEEVAVQEL